MQLQVGMVIEGKVTGITKFGAFVALPEGKSGLVHISEIANTFVNDVHDFVQDGQTVKVKIIGIGDDGKINLSIKKAEDPAPQQRQDRRPPRPAMSQQPRQYSGPRQPMPRANGPRTSSISSCRSRTAGWRTTRCTLTTAPRAEGDKPKAERRAPRLFVAPTAVDNGG